MQISFDFDKFSESANLKETDALDRQIESALEQLGFGAMDWNDEIEGKFVFWLHIHILQDTVNVISDARSGKAMKQEAAEWLFSESSGGFSFFSIARILGADPGELLAKILEMPKLRNGLLGIAH